MAKNKIYQFLLVLTMVLLGFSFFIFNASAATLGISGNKFTIDGQPRFLVLSGYWDGLDAPNPSADLQWLKSKGFDGVRIFPNLWDYCPGCEGGPYLTSGPGVNPVINLDGSIDQGRMNKLISIINTANGLGMVVDVTFERGTVGGDGRCFAKAGNGVMCAEDFKKGVLAVINQLKDKTNVFYDLNNEYDHSMIDLSDGDVTDLKNRIRSTFGNSVILSISSGSPSGSEAINNAQRFGLNLVNVHFACCNRELDPNFYPSSVISSKPTYVGEPYNTSSILDYSSGDIVHAVTEAKKDGIAAWLFHSNASFGLNGKSLQSNFKSNELGFINGFNSALQRGDGGLDPLCKDVTEQSVLQILTKYPPTNPGITEALSEIQQKFGSHVKILYHPERLDKLDFGGGMVVDVVMGSGGDNPSWGWIVESPCGSTSIPIQPPEPISPIIPIGGPPFPIPVNPTAPTQGLPTDLGQLIQQIFAWSLAVLGIAVFVMFFYAGFLWLTAAGNTARVGEAKSRMTNAVLGAILLLSSYLILNTINPDFVENTFNLPGLGETTTAPNN